MSEELLYFNGINGATGGYGLPPMSGEQLSNHILNIETEAPENLAELEERRRQDNLDRLRGEKARLEAEIAQMDPVADAAEIAALEARIEAIRKEAQEKWNEILGVKEGIDPTDLAQTGWGVIFGAKNSRVPQLKEALSPLLQLRQAQAGDLFRIYQSGQCESARAFLARNGKSKPSEPVDPEKTSYYLLIVGDPEEIPFSFQYQLDVQYAVGRIDFGDDLEAYANYANSVVAAESREVRLAPKATFFGVANPGDAATNLSAKYLVKPLYEHFKAEHPDWQIDAASGDEAKKAQLLSLLGGETAPAFLFTATHGMEFPMADERQVPHQGALLCQDWPGPSAWRGEIPQDFYLAGDDLTSEVNLLGLIAFFFACYGGGTPLYDEYSKQAFKQRREAIAEQPFLAALPRAMLSLSKGGAVAVIGHVERAWGTSFLGPGKSEQTTTFESHIERLFRGHPVGSAMEYFNGRYAALSAELTEVLDGIDFGEQYNPHELAGMWTANNDARGYVVIGDPAVRLPVAQSEESVTGRQELEGISVDIPSLPLREEKDELLEKPADADFSDEDWRATPLSVKRYIKQRL